MNVAALRMAPPTMIVIVAIVYIQGLHIGWEYLLVLQVFLQRDAACHDGCELDVVHRAGAGIASKVFFDDFLANPANPSDKAGDGRGVEDRFDELVVRHVVCGIHRVLRFVLIFSFIVCVFGCIVFDRHLLLPPPLLLLPYLFQRGLGHDPGYFCG